MFLINLSSRLKSKKLKLMIVSMEIPVSPFQSGMNNYLTQSDNYLVQY